MAIINGERVTMITNYKIKNLLKSINDLDLNFEKVKIQELVKGLTNDSYILDFEKFMLVLRINNINSDDLGINRMHEAHILEKLKNKPFAQNTIYIDKNYRFILYEYIEGNSIDFKKLNDVDKKKLIELINSYQEIKLELPKFNYFNHINKYWQKIRKSNNINSQKEKKIENFLCDLNNFQKSNWPKLLTHHDLEKNILATKNGYKIIDWEYAANGYYNFDRHSLKLINNNKMISNLIKNMNSFWFEINKIS